MWDRMRYARHLAVELRLATEPVQQLRNDERRANRGWNGTSERFAAIDSLREVDERATQVA